MLCDSTAPPCRIIFPFNYFFLRHLPAALHLAGVGQPLQVLKAIPPFFLATGFFIAVPPFLNRPGFCRFNTGIGLFFLMTFAFTNFSITVTL